MSRLALGALVGLVVAAGTLAVLGQRDRPQAPVRDARREGSSSEQPAPKPRAASTGIEPGPVSTGSEATRPVAPTAETPVTPKPIDEVARLVAKRLGNAPLRVLPVKDETGRRLDAKRLQASLVDALRQCGKNVLVAVDGHGDPDPPGPQARYSVRARLTVSTDHGPVVVTIDVVDELTQATTASERSAISLPPDEPRNGSLKGRVRYTGDLARANVEDTTGDKDPDACGTRRVKHGFVVDPATRALPDAVIFIKKIASGRAFTDGEMKVVLDQKTCQFDKHVTKVAAGGTVVFKNSDSTLHNVKFPSESNGPFNQGIAAGKEVEKTFEKPEIVTLECSIHPWMSGLVVVMPHPYYEVSNAHGEYEMQDIPPGNYVVMAQHQVLGKARKKGFDVEVTAGETTVLDVEFAGVGGHAR